MLTCGRAGAGGAAGDGVRSKQGARCDVRDGGEAEPAGEARARRVSGGVPGPHAHFPELSLIFRARRIAGGAG